MLFRSVTGLTLSGNAEFCVTGSMAVASNANVNELAFDKISFIDDESKPKTSSNYGGTYLFNFNQANATCGKINIKDSEIKYKRGVCRIQTTASIDEFCIDNCIVDSIGGYGITNADNANALINNVVVKNSTLSNCALVFVATKGPDFKSVTVENCTFVYSVRSASRADGRSQSSFNSLSSPVRSFLPSAKVPGAVSVLRRKYDNINGNDTCNYKTFGDTARPLRRCDFAF